VHVCLSVCLLFICLCGLIQRIHTYRPSTLVGGLKMADHAPCNYVHGTSIIHLKDHTRCNQILDRPPADLTQTACSSRAHRMVVEHHPERNEQIETIRRAAIRVNYFSDICLVVYANFLHSAYSTTRSAHDPSKRDSCGIAQPGA